MHDNIIMSVMSSIIIIIYMFSLRKIILTYVQSTDHFKFTKTRNRMVQQISGTFQWGVIYECGKKSHQKRLSIIIIERQVHGFRPESENIGHLKRSRTV